MRKILVSAVLAAVALAMAPSHAATESGTITLPTGTAPRAQRCATALGVENGVLGWTLEVTPGAAFTLAATDANADLQDLDISFYKTLTACEAAADSSATEHVNVEGDEAGTVPADATVAIISLYTGAEATFAYDEAVS